MFRLSRNWVWKPNGILKIAAMSINLLLICILATYDYEPLLAAFHEDYHTFTLIMVTVGGYVIVHCILILGYSFDDTYGKANLQEIMTELLGAVLLASVGSLLVAKTIHFSKEAQSKKFRKIFRTKFQLDFEIDDLWLCSILLLVNALVFLLDACVLIYHTIKSYQKEQKRGLLNSKELEEEEPTSLAWWELVENEMPTDSKTSIQ